MFPCLPRPRKPRATPPWLHLRLERHGLPGTAIRGISDEPETHPCRRKRPLSDLPRTHSRPPSVVSQEHISRRCSVSAYVIVKSANRVPWSLFYRRIRHLSKDCVSLPSDRGSRLGAIPESLFSSRSAIRLACLARSSHRPSLRYPSQGADKKSHLRGKLAASALQTDTRNPNGRGRIEENQWPPPKPRTVFWSHPKLKTSTPASPRSNRRANNRSRETRPLPNRAPIDVYDHFEPLGDSGNVPDFIRTIKTGA